MAKVTITIEGNEEEIRGTLERLLTPPATAAPTEGETAGESEAPAAPAEGWTPEEIEAIWEQITPHSRRILAEIAKRPQGYPFEDLQKVLGLAGLPVAGRLSSVGFAERRVAPQKRSSGAKLVTRDYRARTYTMQPEVAEVIRSLAQSGTDGE